MTSKSPASSIQLGSYQLLERVGEGATAHVHRARGTEGQIVAIKLLAPQAELDDDKARARFEREIRALAGVRHPNLIELLDHGVDDELGPYLVTPLYTGVTLRELMASGPVCPEVMLLVMLPVLDALAALHDVGLVHRDVKPENILATPDGRIVLVDLGLAFEAGQTRYTDDGAVVGSVPYMAPEQIEGGDISAAADVWAAGVVAYELAAGKRPFARARPSEEAAAILVGSFPPLDSAQRQAGPAHAAVIAACLVVDRDARPTAASLAADMRALVDWVDHDHMVSDMAAVVADAADYQRRVATLRTARLVREATRAIDAGEGFAALKLIDRGLAYAPDDDSLRALAGRAEAMASEPSDATEPARSRRGDLAKAALAIVGTAAVIGGFALWQRGGSSDRGAAPSKPPAIAQGDQGEPGKTIFGQPVKKGSDADKALDVFGGMMDLMNEGVTAKEHAAGVGARPHDPKKADDAARRVVGGMFSLFNRNMAADRAAAALRTKVNVAPIPEDQLDNNGPKRQGALAAAEGAPLVPAGYLRGGDPQTRISEVEAALARDPGDAEMHMARVFVYLAAGRTAAGLRHLDKSLAQFPRDAGLWATKGYVELRRGRDAAADLALTKAIDIDPSATNALRNRGILRRRLGRTRDAYRDLARAIGVRPDDAEAMAELIGIYREAGREAAAKPLLDRACKLGKKAACQ